MFERKHGMKAGVMSAASAKHQHRGNRKHRHGGVSGGGENHRPSRNVSKGVAASQAASSNTSSESESGMLA